MSTEEFIRRKNIERYRQLLESDNLAAGQRETITKLLAEEERNPADRPEPDEGSSTHASRS